MNKLNEKMTVGDLISSTNDIPTKKRLNISHTVRLTNVRITPYSGVGKLIATCVSNGKYQTAIELSDVRFSENRTIVPESLDSYVRVKCSCPDFAYRFGRPDLQSKTLMLPYAVKPHGDTPGMCKHIHRLIDVVSNRGTTSM